MQSNDLEAKPGIMTLKVKNDTGCTELLLEPGTSRSQEVDVNKEVEKQQKGKKGNGSSGDEYCESDNGEYFEDEPGEIRPKRSREDTTESEGTENKEGWKRVGKRGNKERKLNSHATDYVREDLQVYISSKELLPKQFAMARLLKENDIKDICGVKYLNPFKVRLEFENHVSMEQLYKCENLCTRGWLMHKPMEVNYCNGIIRDVDSELSDEDILKKITCTENIISAKRLNRRDRSDGLWRASEVVRLCFKGSRRPPHVVVDGLRIKVEPYVYPVSQCYKCWKIGHNIRNCPSKTYICPKCGGSHSNCETKSFTCVNCYGRHISMAKICPVYLKERRLRELMSEFNCTYRKALTLYVPPSPTPLQLESHNDVRQPFPPFEMRQMPFSRSYKDVLTEADCNHNDWMIGKEQERKSGSSIKPQKESKKKVPNRNEKMRGRREQTLGDQFGVDWNIDYESEPNDDEREDDRKTSFSELLSRVKEVIFLNSISIEDKIRSVVKISLEWVVIFFAGWCSDWPIVKGLLYCINNGWFK